MLNHDNTYTDIAIGMRFDSQAIKILNGEMKVRLCNEKGDLVDHKVEIS